MKNLKYLLLVLTLTAGIVYAETSGGLTLPQGGLGITTALPGGILVGSNALRVTSTTSPTVGYITATSTATSTFAWNVSSPCFYYNGGCLSTSTAGVGDGGSKWATSTNGVAIYPNGGTNIAVVIGGTATTGSNLLEVLGNVNINTGSAYKYNNSNIAFGITALRNWFFGNAGNLTVTGVDNTGVGNQALLNVSTGVSNTAVGSSALKVNSSGQQNTAMGNNALASNLGGDGNFALGFNT